VFHGPLKANFTESLKRCIYFGGYLADVENINVMKYLETRINEPAYISSFDGNTESCMAIYPGGAIASKFYSITNHL